MNTLREYNKLRVDYLPLQKQYEFIKQYWGKRLVTIGVNKQDKRYIRYIVRIQNRATLEIILSDREHAQLIADLGGSGAEVQDFYRKCKTTETKFYQLNGPAYCELLVVLKEC